MRRWIFLLFLLSVVAGFFLFGAHRYFTFTYLQGQLSQLKAYAGANPGKSKGLFVALYIALAAISFPGLTVLSLLSGALFGSVVGTLLVSAGSTLGAYLAFLSSRYLFHDLVQKWFGKSLAPIMENFKAEGNFYLLTLRLVPLFPFFAVNVLLGLLPVSSRQFLWTSPLGMLPGTFVYVNAGRSFAELKSIDGILSPKLLLSLGLLAIFPWIAKLAIRRLRKQRQCQKEPGVR